MNPIFSSHSFDFLEKIKAILCNFDEFFSPTRSSGSLCDKKDVLKPILKVLKSNFLNFSLFFSVFPTKDWSKSYLIQFLEIQA